MPVQGISHITILVNDLERSARLFSSVLGARQVYASGATSFSLSTEIFLVIGEVWLVLMAGAPLSETTYNHIAFKIPETEFEAYQARLAAAGVDFREGRPRRPGEGLSLYFYDFDNHLFELHTGTIEARLEAYAEFNQAIDQSATG